jgi:hypothetical protein
MDTVEGFEDDQEPCLYTMAKKWILGDLSATKWPRMFKMLPNA